MYLVCVCECTEFINNKICLIYLLDWILEKFRQLETYCIIMQANAYKIH